MGEDLEDFLARELVIGCPEGILTHEVHFFEGCFCREHRETQAQTRFSTATSYATEMRIKAAYFRALFGATGLDPQTTIDPTARGHAVNEFKKLGLAARPGPHDISGWAQLLVAKRFDLAIGYPPDLEREVRHQAGRVGDRWSEILRYRANQPYSHEVRIVRGASEWYGSIYPHL